VLTGAFTSVASGAAKTVLDQTALVEGFDYSYLVEGATKDFCDFGEPKNSESDELKELHLTKNRSKFRLNQRRMEELDKATEKAAIDYMNVSWNWISQIQHPDMRIINDNDGQPSLLETDYCAAGGDLSTHIYAFGIRDLKDPKSKLSNPHAFIYIPMNVKGKAGPHLGNIYYLVLLSIVNDSADCGDPSNADYARCRALRELAVMQMEGKKGREFREAIQLRIKYILPVDDPYLMHTKFHNGVIHGSL